MDDRALADQYAQTGNLMDLCHNGEWLRESAHVEDAGQVEAGLAMATYSQAVRALTPEQSQQLRQQMQIQSILFTVLQQWMSTWELGAGLEDTYTTARRLVRGHLAALTLTQQTSVEQLLEADAAGRMDQFQQAIVLLSELFTPEDWQVMAETASDSIAAQVLRAKLDAA